VVTDKHQQLMEKKATDPEYNALYKKRMLEANARSTSKKKELLKKAGISSISKLKLIIVDELKSLRDKWSSINENHPSMPVGFNIIDQLLATKKLQDRYIKPATYSFKRAPTSVDLIRDLTDEDTFFHGITMHRMEATTVGQFRDGWMNMGDSGDPMRETPFVAMDVPCVSDNGLVGCMTGLPSELTEKGVMVSLSEDRETYHFTSVLTPAFTISRPHIDSCGRGQILLLVYGLKLLLWWDGSEALRELFANLHGASKGDYTWTAIKKWPGMRWTILHPGEYILMHPGTIHAVLSPVNSAIAGWYFVKEEWVRSEKFRSLLMWEMDMVEHRLNVLNEAEEDPLHILENIDKDMIHWEIWMDSGDLDAGFKVDLKRQKIDIQRRVKILKARIQKEEDRRPLV
jgi:hypothetical protein